MKVIIDGNEYQWDRNLTVREAMYVKEKTGLSVAKFEEGLGEIDPHAVAALMFTVRKRAGEAITWDDVLDSDISVRLVRDEPAEGEAGEASDPKPEPTPGKAGKTRKAATSAT